MQLNHRVLLSMVPLFIAACAGGAKLPVSAGTGTNPTLPPPEQSWLPTLNIAPAVGWHAGTTPIAARGTVVNAFASDLDHPRWLYVLPNGDVLVAETDAPPKPDDSQGLRGWFQKKIMKRAGSGSRPSANRITLLRDSNGDGTAATHSIFLQGLNSPFGMALIGDQLYVADSDAILRFSYKAGATQITEPGTKITDLPAGRINHHWTKSLIASADGSKLFVGVGSNSNAGENGLDAEKERAAIWEVDSQTGSHRVFASGLRNPVGLAWEPQTGALWVSVNERDELGSDLVPDYITAVHDGAFYGWPFSYYGQHLDDRAKPQDAALVSRAVVPDYALGPHTASLGLCSSAGEHLTVAFEHGMFVGQHGSWNRKPFSGYKVIFVPFENGIPTTQPVDVLTGFIDVNGKAQGRPVGVAIDGLGNLLVADDVGGKVWRVSAASIAKP